MTHLLEKALERVRQLPETEQDAIAELIMDELEEEKRWDEAFTKSPETLAKLFAEAESDERAGRIEPGFPKL